MTTRNVGQPFVRRDGRAKVTGEARYSYEVAVPDAVYGVLVTSGIAKGRIVEIDTSAAEREAGVLAVILFENRRSEGYVFPKRIPRASWLRGRVPVEIFLGDPRWGTSKL